MLRIVLTAWLFAVAACAPLLPQPLPDVLILGEQHDAPQHQRLHRDVVEALARRGELAGVAIEMAVAGHTTALLPRNATEAQVRSALDWNERSWPWQAYAPAIMAAVRAGVPVVGADLPRDRLKDAGRDPALESFVSRETLQAHVENIREGHCGLLPEAQLLPMARTQVARDRALAQAAARLASPGKVAVLLTGARHADPQVGVPLHLPSTLRSASRIWPAEPPAADYCEQLRRHFAPTGRMGALPAGDAAAAEVRREPLHARSKR
jgi:uncharacterized iron-regulated protein